MGLHGSNLLLIPIASTAAGAIGRGLLATCPSQAWCTWLPGLKCCLCLLSSHYVSFIIFCNVSCHTIRIHPECSKCCFIHKLKLTLIILYNLICYIISSIVINQCSHLQSFTCIYRFHPFPLSISLPGIVEHKCLQAVAQQVDHTTIGRIFGVIPCTLLRISGHPKTCLKSLKPFIALQFCMPMWQYNSISKFYISRPWSALIQ